MGRDKSWFRWWPDKAPSGRGDRSRGCRQLGLRVRAVGCLRLWVGALDLGVGDTMPSTSLESVCGCQGGFCSLMLISPVSFLPSPSLFPLCAGARSHREPDRTGLVLSKPGVCWKERHCGPDSLRRQGGLPGGGVSGSTGVHEGE